LLVYGCAWVEFAEEFVSAARATNLRRTKGMAKKAKKAAKKAPKKAAMAK
jgi:hypothetical protein